MKTITVNAPGVQRAILQHMMMATFHVPVQVLQREGELELGIRGAPWEKHSQEIRSMLSTSVELVSIRTKSVGMPDTIDDRGR